MVPEQLVLQLRSRPLEGRLELDDGGSVVCGAPPFHRQRGLQAVLLLVEPAPGGGQLAGRVGGHPLGLEHLSRGFGAGLGHLGLEPGRPRRQGLFYQGCGMAEGFEGPGAAFLAPGAGSAKTPAASLGSVGV